MYGAEVVDHQFGAENMYNVLMSASDPSAGRPILRGPFSLFDNSFIVEFLSPPDDLDATVLIRTTLPAAHPLLKKGKSHPFVPPLHLHFSQSESLVVVKGALGVTVPSSSSDWTPKDRVLRPSDGVVEIPPWAPHTLWPTLEAGEEEVVFLLWAHPRRRGEEDMDHLFFETLFRYMDEKKGVLDPLQMCLLSDASATTHVVFPSAKILGPLRWMVPWCLQWMFARLAVGLGYTPLLDRFLKSE